MDQEQTNAKTALLFLSCKLDIPFGLIDESAAMRVSDTVSCISDLQSHIVNLEAQNKEMREALEKIMDVMLNTIHNGTQTEPYKIARKAVYGEE